MVSAKSHLEKITETYRLCQNKTGLSSSKGNCFAYTIKNCEGACIQAENPESYNKRASNLIKKYSYENKSMLIIDRGREVDERSVVLIEDGIFKGIGFYNLNFQLNTIDILKSIITPMDNNRDAQHIIQSYLRSKKVKKVIPLDQITT